MNADTTTGDGAAIDIDSLGSVKVGLIKTGAGAGQNVDLDAIGGSITATAGAGGVADIIGDTINLTADTGGIGPIEVTATTELNADTKADGANINIDSIGDLPVGLVDAAGGDVILNSTIAINDATADTTVDIIANVLTLTAQGEIGGTRELETTVGSLDASAQAAGDIVIAETSGITLTDVDTADGAITINTGGSTIVTDVAASGSGDEDDVAITAASGDITIDVVSAAGSGDVTIEASGGSINETGAGEAAVDITADVLTLTAQDEIGGAGEMDIETEVASLAAHSTTGDIVIVEKDDVVLKDILADAGSIYLEATGGGMTYGAGTTITAGASTLTMIQQDSLDLKDFTFANQNGTDFMAEITAGSFTAVDTANGGKDDNAADKWQSIQAKASGNITLQGSEAARNIVIGTGTGINPGGGHTFDGVVTSTGGGVSIISDNQGIVDGWNSTNGTTLDNVTITGYSDTTGSGVKLPVSSEPGTAAIVIWSKLKDLNLGPNATLTANGSYDDSVATGVDDRLGVNFLIPPPESAEAGERIDVAIYLGSFNHILPGGAGGNITVDSTVLIPLANGTMVIDAYDTVEPFGIKFTDSDPWSNITNSLEVVSRISQTLDDAADNKRLPHADEARSDIVPSWFRGEKYVLRGKDAILAEVLGKIEPVPLVLPKPLEPEDQGQVEIERRDAAVLGLGDKPELARAYPPSLNTDLNLDKAAQILFVLMPILRDSSRIAILNNIVVEIWQDVDQPITPEQEAMIAQRMSGTPAEEWVAALTEYVDVMSTMVGRPKTESVLWVMQTYVIPQAEQGLLQDQTVAFLEAQID